MTAKKLLELTNPKDLIGATKPRLALVPGTAIVHLSQAMEDGANKYGAFNWRNNKVQLMIYADALLRHAFSYIDGENYTKDSRVKHLAAIMANCAILIDAEEGGNLIDDRPKAGTTSSVLNRLTKHD